MGNGSSASADALELRIRILPDDINIDSFEGSLTPAELGRGQPILAARMERR